MERDPKTSRGAGAWFAERLGVGLLAVTTEFVFTGTVIKWDQEGFEAPVHNEAIARLLGSLG